MLSISHSLTGAFIASQLPNPVVYIPLTLASHYLEDWIPHWDVGTGLSNGNRKKSTAILLEVVDLVLTVGLIAWFWQASGQLGDYHLWVGALTGIAPDLAEAPRNFLGWEPAWLKPINQFHNHFHHSTPNMMVGMTPQIALLVSIFFLK